jgi:hypothetical protein
MCTEQLPPGGYPIAVKYIIPYNDLLGRDISTHVKIVMTDIPFIGTEFWGPEIL